MRNQISFEKEFESYKERHKYSIVLFTLYMHEYAGIYEIYPGLQKYLEMDAKDRIDRAYMVLNDFYYKKENLEKFNELYEFCWKVSIKNETINDDQILAFNIL